MLHQAVSVHAGASVSAFMMRLYDLRGRLVHGDTVADKHLIVHGCHFSMREYAYHGANITRRAIWWALERTAPGAKVEIELDAVVFHRCEVIGRLFKRREVRPAPSIGRCTLQDCVGRRASGKHDRSAPVGA